MRRALRSSEVSAKSRKVGEAAGGPRLPLALSLQSLVGNRATSQLLAQGQPQVSVMRTIATTPQQMKAVRGLIEGPIGGQSSYDKLRAAVNAYHGRSGQTDALRLVNTILGLADSWLEKYGKSTNRAIVAKRRVVETLHAEALREKGVLRAQRRYVEDVQQERFRAMRGGTAENSLGRAKAIVKGDPDLNTREAKGHALATEFNLTSADITAIRVYSAQDYQYINPAVANDPAWMKERNKGQKLKALPPADGAATVDEDMASQTDVEDLQDYFDEAGAPRTDALEDLADQADSGGLIRSDPIDAMGSSEIDATDQAEVEVEAEAEPGPSSSLPSDAAQASEQDFDIRTWMEEGALHGGMASVAFEKLPTWDGVAFRGARYTPEEFEAIKAIGELSFPSYTSSSQSKSKAREFALAAAPSPAFTVSVVFVMDVHNGRDIQFLAVSETEREVVLPPGSRLKVTKIEEEKRLKPWPHLRRYLVYCEQFAPPVTPRGNPGKKR